MGNKRSINKSFTRKRPKRQKNDGMFGSEKRKVSDVSLPSTSTSSMQEAAALREKKSEANANQAGDGANSDLSFQNYNAAVATIKIEFPDEGYPQETLIFVTDAESRDPGSDDGTETNVEQLNLTIKAEPCDEPEQITAVQQVSVFTHEVNTEEVLSDAVRNRPVRTCKQGQAIRNLIVEEPLIQPPNDRLLRFIKSLPKRKIHDRLPVNTPILGMQAVNIIPITAPDEKRIVASSACTLVKCPKCAFEFDPLAVLA